MLDIVKNTLNQDFLPFTEERVTVSRTGLLELDGAKTTLSVINSTFNFKLKDIKDVIVLVFHELKHAPVYWDRIQALALDDNDIRPETLIPSFRNGPVESITYPGFYLIPKFSNYIINRQGMLYKISDGVFIKASKAVSGYYTYRMTSDVRKTQNQLRHRVMLMAFKEYPATVRSLDVNHLNGVPGDDFLDNLEWCTRTENNSHAVRSGLRTQNIEVLMRRVIDDRLFIFESYSAAGRFLGVTETTVSNRIARGEEYVRDGFQIKNLNDGDFVEPLYVVGGGGSVKPYVKYSPVSA